jgi:rSAM/selenodomain-associated transferase 2
MKPPSLAIVIPVLNEAARLPTLLAALQLLRARGAELIVADGGSRDCSRELSAPLADRVIDAPRGRARQMNAGAAVARGDVLLFLHADTTLPEDADRLIERALATGAAWGRFDVRIDGRSRWLPVVGFLMNLRSRWTGIATGDQAMFIRREVFEHLGRFPDQPLMEDIELCKRLLAAGHRPACLRERVSTSGRRWDERGPLRTIVLMWCLRWRYWRGASAQSIWEAYR